MAENDFVPLSPQLGVAGSSYRLQMGQVNGYWAIRLAKGNDVLESKVFKDEPNKEMPNSNKITGWVLSVIAIPNINTFQIQKTVGFVRQKAMEAFEDFKRKKESQGKSESGSVTLDKIPDGAQVKRPQGPGWVKEDKPISEADKQAVVESSPGLATSNANQPIKPVEPAVTTEVKSAPVETPAANYSSGKRSLNPIPRGEGFVESAGSSATPVEKKEPATSIDQKAKLQSDLEKRVAEIEKQMKKLQTELDSVKSDLAKLK